MGIGARVGARLRPSARSGGRRVTVVSPHFDDVPLSLGQSLRDGALSSCRVRVRVAFGRSNWTSWVHPTPERARYVSLWRRGEETAASLVFGYRWTAAGWQEVLLREGEEFSDSLLDRSIDLSSEPLVDELASWLRAVVDPGVPGGQPELLLVAAGLGGHVDHRILALAAASLVGDVDVPIGFYEDRPYAAYLDDADRAEQLAPLGLDLRAVDVSGPMSRSTQMWARRCYPSQMAPFFEEAMDLDRVDTARERVWFPVGLRPDWF
ncbi:hypothetical protein BH10ACT3_BH10ACT3_12610 [soil metagenome]